MIDGGKVPYRSYFGVFWKNKLGKEGKNEHWGLIQSKSPDSLNLRNQNESLRFIGSCCGAVRVVIVLVRALLN